MTLSARIAYSVSLVLFLLVSASAFADLNTDLDKFRTDWAIAKYQTPRNKQKAAFETLIRQGESLNQHYQHQPRVMLWYSTALCSYAAIKGGLGALPDAKKARVLLEEVLHLDSHIEDGFAQGVLGTLYARVPGWPVAFGNKEKARQLLKAAVQINPQGSDVNYYYGDFLVNTGEYNEAKKYLAIAQAAPIRQNYEIQDRGRKGEIATSMAKLQRLGH